MIIFETNIILVFKNLFVILESKENEIIELQNKLETVTKELESCQNEAESNMDQLKIVKLEPAASEALSEEDDDDKCKKVDESGIPEEFRVQSLENELKMNCKGDNFNYFLN